MTRKNAVIVSAIATILMGSAAFAGPKADANQDGVITRAEFMAESQSKFASFDSNGDGYISEDERTSARENGQAERRTAMFGQIDANGDGVISRDEFEAAGDNRKEKSREKRRQRRDVNQDGQVDEADREAFREKMSERRERMKERRQQRSEGSQGRRRGNSPWLRADTNGDKLISAQEFQAGAEKMFEHLDADGDGQLTQGEGRGKRKRKGKRFGR